MDNTPTKVNEADDVKPKQGGTPSALRGTELEIFHQLVSDKVAEFDPTKVVDKESEFTTTDTIPWSTIYQKQANCCDKTILGFAIMGSMLFGGAMPGFCLMFGEMIDGVGGAEGIDSLKDQAVIMVFVGIFSMIFSGLQITLWSIFAQRIAEKTRIAYFRACLHKDAAYYDEHSPAELASKISKEVQVIQRGLGEKPGQILMSVFGFLFGFTFAFYWGWVFTLILLAAFPFLVIVGMAMGIALAGGVTE